MKRMKQRLILLLLIPLFLISCSTNKILDDTIKEWETADLIGIVYDSTNRPCMGAIVTLEERPDVTYPSDINGRVIISDLPRGVYQISIDKAGHQGQKMILDFTSRKQVLYVRLTSQQTILDAAESEMEQKNWNEAGDLIEKARVIDPEDSRFMLLDGAFAYRMEDYEKALESWTALYEKGHRESYLYLMLADCYEYGLQDIDSTLDWLAKYLEIRSDSSIDARYRKLLSEKG